MPKANMKLPGRLQWRNQTPINDLEVHMSEIVEFQGFSKETVAFFETLKKNNNKAWFDGHRQDYENHVLKPAKAFVVAMGEKLRAAFPGIIASPKVNKSLFRITRDTRFRLDKRPYKTNLGIFFWEGSRPRMECSGFYFHLEPPKFLLGAGGYMLPRRWLDRYRRMVVDPEYGEELADVILKISKLKCWELGGRHYKRIPPGYDASHPNADLLLHNGLYAGCETDIPDELYSRKLIDYCWKKFHAMAPLHKWLVSIKMGFI